MDHLKRKPDGYVSEDVNARKQKRVIPKQPSPGRKSTSPGRSPPRRPNAKDSGRKHMSREEQKSSRLRLLPVMDDLVGVHKPPLPQVSAATNKKVMFKLDEDLRSQKSKYQLSKSSSCGDVVSSGSKVSPQRAMVRSLSSSNQEFHRLGYFNESLESERRAEKHTDKNLLNLKIGRKKSLTSLADLDTKNILIHKNSAMLKKILQEWHYYSLKKFKSRMLKKGKKKEEKVRLLKPPRKESKPIVSSH